LFARLLKRRPSTVILQYPTQGYGWSLVPHLLLIYGRIAGRFRPVLALHEFGSLSRKSRFALALVSHFAHRVVFTAEAERQTALAHPLFSRTVPASIIPILSNIAMNASPPPFHARSVDIAYFGHIRPNKGLETFLDTIERVREMGSKPEVAVFGKVPAGYEDFARGIAHRCEQNGCRLVLDLDDDAAARALSDVKVLYLPYPDGISARRGTALAGFANGAIVATRIGTATPKAILPAIIAPTAEDGDAAMLRQALELSAEGAEALQRAGRAYLAKTLPRDWRHVAELYEQAIGANADGG
jgi:glycosyltransferase involved in cell wall biosynthesis